MKAMWGMVFLVTPLWGFGQFSGSVTQGLGTTVVANLMPDCPSNHLTPWGTIVSTDNKTWKVPAETHFLAGPYAADLFNPCTNTTPANLAAADLSAVPVTEIDTNGELITGFLFCDNYFELYVNGVLVAVDPVPFTPFNSSVVKFRVSRPYTLAVKLVDWEENPGLGTEVQNGNNYHPGDGGFIARFSDGTTTNANWKAQTFYMAPIQDLNAVEELPDGTRSTAAATLTPSCSLNCFGIHYEEPINWMEKNFNDQAWPNAKIYSASQVTNQPAYTYFATSAWPDAEFIWSSNLILDNVVLARYTVQELTSLPGETDNIPRLRWNPEIKLLEAQGDTSPGLACDIRISDALGRLYVPLPQSNSQWKLSDLSPGIYLVRFQRGFYIALQKIIIP